MNTAIEIGKDGARTCRAQKVGFAAYPTLP